MRQQIKLKGGKKIQDSLLLLNPGFRARVIGVCVDGHLFDTHMSPGDDVTGELITIDDPLALPVLRHSTAHVMAEAVQRLVPGTKVTIGPPIDDGFYYDFDFPQPIGDDLLAAIEKEMSAIIATKEPFQREEVSHEAAADRFMTLGETYKLEILAAIPNGDPVSIYHQGNWFDLCRGPHVPHVGMLGAFKLLKLAGAYWRGDEKNKMLTRIYGTTWSDGKQLKAYLNRLHEAEQRDHRRIGTELELFTTMGDNGPGLILWLPKGALIRKTVEDFWREEHLRAGYQLVFTPHVAKIDLWNTSGHTAFYRENMYATMEVDHDEYQLKPMNCPFHIKAFQHRLRSYRDLPIRLAELGTVYRYERSGVLHGLMRVRGFTQDDAHIFCSPEQIVSEISGAIDFVMFVLRAFGFAEYEVYLSTRPEKSVGGDDQWDQATSALKVALEQKRISYQMDPGEGVFYGPKIDVKIKDVLGRTWQCSTIQVDFNLPERFDITYVTAQNSRARPIMIHRALLGSLERFFGVLIEHYAGAFPLWLSPTQVMILTVTNSHDSFATATAETLRSQGIRADCDFRNLKLGNKIREATTQKCPYMLIVGDKEVEARSVTPRRRNGEVLASMPLEQFLDLIKEEARPPRRNPS